MSEGKTTVDHGEIQRWAEERDGVPASVKGTAKGKGNAGLLRLDFPPKNEELEEISWDEFFEKFDKEKLAFLYQDETADGSVSRFHKFIERGDTGKSRSASKSTGAGKNASSGKSASAGKGRSKSKSSTPKS